MLLLTAEHVLPISSDPIRNGAVAIDEGAIASVGPSDEIIARFPDAKIEDMGEAAILPGFVNCHSHLEITGLRGALDSVENDFRAWLLRLNELRAEMSDDEITAAAYLGAMEGAAAGVTCFGDIGRNARAGFRALKTRGPERYRFFKRRNFLLTTIPLTKIF